VGSDIGDLFERRESELGTHLRGRIVVIDAYNTIYQFLSSIRQRDGTLLKDSRERVTSHLSGLLYRISRQKRSRNEERYGTRLIESGRKRLLRAGMMHELEIS